MLVRDDQEADPSRRFKLVYQAMVPLDRPHQKQFADRHQNMGRAKFLAYGPDTEHFRNADENPLLSPNDGFEEEDHHLMMSPYGGAWIICYEYGWHLPTRYGLYGTYAADVRLAVSDNGLNFTRLDPRQPVIARGAHTEWDGGLLVIADKPVVKDGTIYLFYGGAGEDFTSWPPENRLPNIAHDGGSTSGRVARMGLATLREDGFTCLQTPDRETPGSATTTPFERADRRTALTVNVGDVRLNRSWVEIEVLAANTNEPIDGFTRQDCDDICIDGLRRPVAWGAKRIAEVETDVIKLRFWLYGAARLYAYGFE